MSKARRARVTDRSRRRDRHGRGLRSSAAGPHLPFLRTRVDLFDDIVAATADYLREAWPDELADTSFEVAGLEALVFCAGLTAVTLSMAWIMRQGGGATRRSHNWDGGPAAN